MGRQAKPPFGNRADLERLLTLLAQNLIGIADDSGDFFIGTFDGHKCDIKSWHSWDWTQGVGLYGLVRIHERTGDPVMLARIRDWFAARSAEPAPPKTINTMAPLYAAAYLSERSRDEALSPLLLEWADWAMRDLPRTDEGGFQHITINQPHVGQLWDDSLMMTVMPLAKIGLMFDRTDYLDEAVRQFVLHVKYLADRVSGLWFHGWSFPQRDHMSRALWARGNAWVTMVIPDFIELMGNRLDGGVAAFLRATLVRQAEALAACQRGDGLWPTLLDDPDSYGEASATAGIGYGILKGVRLGLLDPDLRETGERAVAAVVGLIDPETGSLDQVSFGTPIFDTLDEYRRVPITTMPYGQAMAMLALDEALRIAE
jgi:unsaturated rhamnogalacturonyl hydrolase